MAEILEVRRRERDRLIGLARGYVERLSRRLPVVAAAVVGSVARGDFNVWSDVDVIVVVDELPVRAPDRGSVLSTDAPAGVQVIGFTPHEFLEALTTGNPLAHEATEVGVVLRGDGFFHRSHRGG